MELNPSSSLLAADSNPADVNFIISGVQDMTLDGETGVLQLSVKAANGTQEPVTLSVSGLPAHTTVAFSPATGTPPFTTSMTLTAAFDAQPGTFPFTIVATSTYLVRYYFLTVTCPASNPESNFFNANGNTYQLSQSSWFGNQLMISTGNRMSSVGIAFNFPNSTPAPGTYTVIDWNAETIGAMQVGISSQGNTNINYSEGNNGNTITVSQDSNNKLSIIIPPAPMYGTSNTTLYGAVHE